MGYEPYLVAPSNTGISKYLKPWLQPEDALVDMQDCYTYRGVIQKRYGFNLYGVFVNRSDLFTNLIGDGATLIFDLVLPNVPIGKKSLTIRHTYPAGTVNTDGTDDGAGVLTGTNIAAGSTINYATGAVHIVFTNAPIINTPITLTYGTEIAVGNGTTGPYAGSLALTPVSPRSVFVKNTDTNQTSAPFDVPNATLTTGSLINGSPPGVTAGTVTYATGAISGLTFTNVIPAGNSIWAQWQYIPAANPIKGIKFFWNTNSIRQTIIFNNLQAGVLDPANFRIVNITGSDIFTTQFAGFFNVANYQNKSFIVNNANRLTVYDGSSVYQPIVATVNATPTTNDVTTALGVVVYKNRLCLIRPVENGVVQPQRIRFSALNNPFVWASDVQGKGGFIDAPTPEWIISYEFLHDELIVNFQESTWRFRYTGVDTTPYRWEKINDTRLIDSSYANVGYNSWITSVGNTGLLKCDGVNTDRYDEKIIDFTKDEIEQADFNIVNGYRNDVLNQQYLCYSSKFGDPNNTEYCDKWLVWNFLENSFAIFNIFSTCFGSYYQTRDLAWQDLTFANGFYHPPYSSQEDIEWQDLQDENWLSYFSMGGAKIPIFGTENGEIMTTGLGNNSDNGVYTGFSFLTKQFNPYVKEGQMAVLGYVDFYFDNPSPDTEPDPDYLISIDYFVDEQEDPQLTEIINPSLDDWKHKRVFINNNGQFHSFRIYLSDDQINGTNTQNPSSVTRKGLICNGYILYFKRGGRIVG